MSTTFLNEAYTFKMSPGRDGTLAGGIIQLSSSFNGRIAFESQTRLAPHNAVASATAAIVREDGTSDSTVIGTPTFSPDMLTVVVPLSGFTADQNYVLTVTVTSTDTADTFELSGSIHVEP